MRIIDELRDECQPIGTAGRHSLDEPVISAERNVEQKPKPGEVSIPEIVAGEPNERRSEPRIETTIAGRLRLPATEHDCKIADLSMGGMNIVAPDAPITVGLQVSVFSQGLPRLVGIVRWIGGGSFGIKFVNPITQDVLERIGELKRRVRSSRAGRVETDFPAIVFFDGSQHDVVIRNMSVGGLMMITCQPSKRGRRKPIREGQPLMIQIADLLPIGGHVRWSCGSQYGVMFSKYLSVSMAHEIARLGKLSGAWIDDVYLAHMEIKVS